MPKRNPTITVAGVKFGAEHVHRAILKINGREVEISPAEKKPSKRTIGFGRVEAITDSEACEECDWRDTDD